jgi:hypothetical protein
MLENECARIATDFRRPAFFQLTLLGVVWILIIATDPLPTVVTASEQRLLELPSVALLRDIFRPLQGSIHPIKYI